MVYNTKQKAAILGCIKNIGNKHFTIDDVVNLLSAQGDKIGRTTVYRTLERLADDGALRKYAAALGESACYQYVAQGEDCHRHFHLKCEKCGALIHLECDEITELSNHMKKHHGFNLNMFKTVLYGVCEKCAE